jgi:ComF family protein
MVGLVKSLLEDFLSLFYPRLCLACQQEAIQLGQITCITCEYTLQNIELDLHLEKQNKVTEKFWGRVQIKYGAALYPFTKDGRTQKLIHQLKYKGKKEIGVLLGKRMGRKLKEVAHFRDVDFIIPVPLHPKKLRIRGYNQAALIAEGLSQSMQIPHLSNGLVRSIHSKSQTKKTREERFKNVESVFQIGEPSLLEGKHILLVDDVLTTGATLESCALQLLALPNTTISIAVIGLVVDG